MKLTTGNTEIPLTQDCFVRVDLQASQPMVLVAKDGTGTFNAGVIQPRRGQQTLRQRYRGLQSITLVPKSPKEAYRVSYSVKNGSPFEKLDDIPPPEPVQAKNLLARMRQEFRQQMGVTREHFITDQAYPGYEIDDDDPGLFEEEMAEQARQQKLEQDNQTEKKPADQDKPEVEETDTKPEQTSEKADP